MRWADLPFEPADRTLRQFATLCLIVFVALAGWQEVVHQRIVTAIGLAILATTIGVIGIMAPRAIRFLYVGWMLVVFPLAWLISRVTLALAYFLVVTPLGACSRILRRDPLALHPNEKKESYWSPLRIKTDLSRYFRQYL